MQVMALQPEPMRQRTFAWMGSAGTWEGGSKGCNLTNGRRISSKPPRVKSDISSNLGNEGKPRHLRRSEGTARNRRYSGEGIVHTQNAGWSNGAGNAEQGHEFPHFSASNVGPPYKLLTKVDAAMRKELTCLGVCAPNSWVVRVLELATEPSKRSSQKRNGTSWTQLPTFTYQRVGLTYTVCLEETSYHLPVPLTVSLNDVDPTTRALADILVAARCFVLVAG